MTKTHQDAADPRKYIQVASAVRQAIDDGRLTPGGPVPVLALAADHGTSRHTMAKALCLLAAEGWTEQLPNCGWYVTGTVGAPARAGSTPAPVAREATATASQATGDQEVGPKRLWEQLACSLRQQLDDGTRKPGDLVTIGALLRERGLRTRRTAGRALRLLEQEGRLRRIPGYGYVVQHPQSQDDHEKPGE